MDIDIEVNLCRVLQNMKLEGRCANDRKETGNPEFPSTPPNTDVQDFEMLGSPTYQPDAWDCSTQTSTTTTNGDKQDGCTYLQAVRAQLDSYQTTGGEYLEAIFTHRAVFNAYPPGHKSCAKGFSDIACALERRAWRADRDSDAEAVVAFRYEAWKIATLL